MAYCLTGQTQNIGANKTAPAGWLDGSRKLITDGYLLNFMSVEPLITEYLNTMLYKFERKDVKEEDFKYIPI